MIEEDSVRNHLPGFYHSLGASGQNTVLTSDSPAGAGVHHSHSSHYSKMPCLKASLKIQALLDFSHWRRFANDSPGSRRQQEGRLTYILSPAVSHGHLHARKTHRPRTIHAQPEAGNGPFSCHSTFSLSIQQIFLENPYVKIGGMCL